MNYVLTNAQMREADRFTIDALKIPSLLLMERAGAALAEEAERLCPEDGDLVVVCGGGNNGGDGFVCARILLQKGRDVAVVCVAEKFTEECKKNKEEFEKLGGEVFSVFPRKRFSLAVDCLFGTGFQGAGREKRRGGGFYQRGGEEGAFGGHSLGRFGKQRRRGKARGKGG